MFCCTCFASHNTWLAGPAVDLRTECTYLHNKRKGCKYYQYCYIQLLIVVCEVWYCVPGMAIDTSSGTGRRQPIDCVLLLDELAMMIYDAMDFASETGSLQGLTTADKWQLSCGGEACVVGCVADWKATRTTCLVLADLIICVFISWSRRGCARRARDGSQNS